MMCSTEPDLENRKLKVLFFTASLGGGGAERHLLRLINHLDRQQVCPLLALTKAGGSYEVDLRRDVPIHFLKTGKIASSTLQMIRSIIPLRRLMQAEQPDLICSVMTHANLVAILATMGLKQPPKVVISVQNPPSIQSKNWLVKWFLLSLLPWLYPKADRTIALSEGVAVDLVQLVPQIRDRIQVIYNAGYDEQVLAAAQQPLPSDLQVPHPLVVACGRLTPQKDFLTLLDAFAEVNRRRSVPTVLEPRTVLAAQSSIPSSSLVAQPSNSLQQASPAHLWIIGEGSQRLILEKKIRELDLEDRVKLLGFQQNPFQWMRSADIFVLSSIYEGFGNVLVEAMACGTPVIATDCPAGPREIIQHEVNGLLVPVGNVDAIANAIVHLLTYPKWREKLSDGGQVRAKKFHSQTIAMEYAAMFKEIILSGSD
ncbi:MAG: glycosyltransferase [Elainella sp. Prado103]|nr:glycosyltransferase [Elainella sp. Prado103]